MNWKPISELPVNPGYKQFLLKIHDGGIIIGFFYGDTNSFRSPDEGFLNNNFTHWCEIAPPSAISKFIGKWDTETLGCVDRLRRVENGESPEAVYGDDIDFMETDRDIVIGAVLHYGLITPPSEGADVDPKRCGGMAVIAGARFTVSRFVEELIDAEESFLSVCLDFGIDHEIAKASMRAMAACASRASEPGWRIESYAGLLRDIGKLVGVSNLDERLPIAVADALKAAKSIESSLAEALEELMEWQNGPPLSTLKWIRGWNGAMDKACAALALRQSSGEHVGEGK